LAFRESSIPQARHRPEERCISLQKVRSSAEEVLLLQEIWCRAKRPPAGAFGRCAVAAPVVVCAGDRPKDSALGFQKIGNGPEDARTGLRRRIRILRVPQTRNGPEDRERVREGDKCCGETVCRNHEWVVFSITYHVWEYAKSIFLLNTQYQIPDTGHLPCAGAGMQEFSIEVRVQAAAGAMRSSASA